MVYGWLGPPPSRARVISCYKNPLHLRHLSKCSALLSVFRPQKIGPSHLLCFKRLAQIYTLSSTTTYVRTRFYLTWQTLSFPKRQFHRTSADIGRHFRSRDEGHVSRQRNKRRQMKHHKSRPLFHILPEHICGVLCGGMRVLTLHKKVNLDQD
jgi:hypothetical protein